ncbi:Glycosyltransferase [Metarhizium guizhouense ARSEF 977]|uniref:Glycosyltransferase n=1 Tax=Metarhizium guizhouense (strain ARSEF 977) TaxID=1276136 RepID=A0A0B4GX28_METGA|nr:Glycosyltransferase [Metarhizium guizhouense ARSEF 977]
MRATFRSPRKLITLLVLSLVAVLVLHQLSFHDQFLLCGSLSESMKIVDACPRSNIKTSNESLGTTRPGIPNVIHQIWKTEHVETYSAEASHASWRAQAESRNYTLKLWTDNDILQLIKAKYAWLLSTYEGYAQDIQRADMARLVVVHAEGGIYADLDVYPVSVDELSCLRHLGLRAIFSPTAGNAGLSNHFFMAEQGADFLQWALYEGKRRGGPLSKHILLPYLRVFWSTGPLMVTSAFRQYSWMYGASSHGLGVLGASYGGFVVRHAAGRSWHGLDGYLLNYVADHVRVESLWVGGYCLVALLALVFISWRWRWRSMRYR